MIFTLKTPPHDAQRDAPCADVSAAGLDTMFAAMKKQPPACRPVDYFAWIFPPFNAISRFLNRCGVVESAACGG